MAFRRHPIWGLGSYLMALYISPAHNWFGASLPSFRWSLFAAVCLWLSIFFKPNRLTLKTPWLRTGPGKIILLYAVWMWIQLGWAVSFKMHLDGTILITKYLVLYFMIYKILSSDTDYYLFLLFNIMGSFYVARSVLAYSGGGRVEGVGGPGINDSNSLGMHLSVILIFCSILLLKKNTIFLNNLYWRICHFGVFVAAAYIANASVQAISRSAVLGILFGGMVMFFIKHWTVKKKFYVYLILGFCGLLYFAPYTFWERLDSITEAVQGEEVESSAYSRIIIGQAQLEMFKDNILGHGHRGTFVLSRYYLPPEYLTWSSVGGAGRSSHCTFLTTLTEQGIPGAILYLSMFFWTVRTIISFPKDDPVIYLYFMGASAALASIFVSGLFVDYFKAEIQIYCLALLASLKDYQLRSEYQKMQAA